MKTRGLSMDVAIEKVVEKMQGQEEIDLQDFRRSLSAIRFDKFDASKILKEMKLLGIIRLKKDRNGCKIVFI